MQIVIISRGNARWNVQRTARTLLEARIDFTLAVPLDEFKAYAAIFPWGQPIVALPKMVKTMAECRDAVLYDLFPGQDVCMMDDDLRFYARTALRSHKFVEADLGAVRNLVDTLKASLTGYPCVGVVPRESGNRRTGPVELNARVRGVVAYRSDVAQKGYLFSPLDEIFEVDHMTLQILRGGQDVLCLNQWSVRGASKLVSPLRVAISADKLACAHRGFVKAVANTARIQWKQARRATG